MNIVERLVSGYPQGDVSPQDFIDHLSIGAEGWIGAWVAVGLAVCVCRRGGATAAYQTMNMPFQMMNMPVVTSQYWNIVYEREEWRPMHFIR